MKITDRLLACILLATPSFGHADNWVFDGNALLKSCKTLTNLLELPRTTIDEISKAAPTRVTEGIICMYYVRGFDEGIQVAAVNNSVKKHGTKAIAENSQYTKNELLYCSPNAVTLEQKIRVITHFLENNPQRLHEMPAVLTSDALRDAFPCK